MKGQDHPVRHFELMVRVAGDLRALPAQILEHHYHYAAFGSWSITLKRQGHLFRVVFDGKERLLRLERATSAGNENQWQQVLSRPAGDPDSAQDLQDVLSQLRAL